MSPAGYAVCEADLQLDRAAVLDLWRGHVAMAPEAKYQWFYLDHPERAPTLLMLTHGEHAQRVGVAGLAPRSMRVQGRDRTAAILADLLVQPGHRTLFPALLLQKHMQRLALQRYRIVYGFPNQNSTPIVKRLGYTKMGELTRYSNVLRFGDYLERRIPSWLSRTIGSVADRVMPFYFRPYRLLLKRWSSGWTNSVDARFDDLWQRAGQLDGVIGVRDARFLAWRFQQRPGTAHRFFTVSPAGRERHLTAYAACEAEGSTLHVRDFLADPSREDHLRLLLHLLSRQAYREGFANLSLAFMGSTQLHGTLVGAGMMERSRRALYACFHAEDDAQLRRLDWYVTEADED